jgi:hypothetical protein
MVLAGGPDFPVPSLVGPNISTMSYVVRSTISSSELMPLVQRATHSVDPQLALAQVRTRQNRVSIANGSQASRSGKLMKRKDLRGKLRWSRGRFPFSKPLHGTIRSSLGHFGLA